MATSEKKNNISEDEKNRIFNIEVIDRKITNNISVGKEEQHFQRRSEYQKKSVGLSPQKGVHVLKKNRIFNIEVSDRKKQTIFQ